MEKALSLKTNEIIFAKDVNYEMSKQLTPVCPECKEPVHLRKKVSTTGTSYFAHHALKDDTEDACSLRVFSYWEQAHTNSGMWASRGQLIAKIQVELIAFFSDQFGEEKEEVTKLIRGLIDGHSDFEWAYTDLLKNLASADHIYAKVRDETTLGNDEGREIVSHYNLAIACLKGSKLQMATQGLLWCSFVVANTLSDIYLKNPDPPVGVMCDGREFDLCLDPLKYQNLLASHPKYPTQRNHIYYRCVSISQRLLIRLLTSWKHPQSLRRNFLSICDKPQLVETTSKNSKIKETDETPFFHTLEERNRWLSERKR